MKPKPKIARSRKVRKHIEEMIEAASMVFYPVYGNDIEAWPNHIYRLMFAMVNAHWIESNRTGKTLFGERV